MSGRPRALTIAGSDSGGGAGIQADLKTFGAFGAYGMSVVTAVTAQNTTSVSAVHEVPAEVVAAQLAAVLGDIGTDAIKIGMLSSAKLVQVVAEGLADQSAPIVLDPVMVSKSGDALLQDAAVEALIEHLLPLATVVTPNLPELERLTGCGVETEQERVDAADKLAHLGPAVLVKGGHGRGAEVIDLLVLDGEVVRFSHRRLVSTSTHGTGCTLAAAIAAGLAFRRPLEASIGSAIDYLHGAIAAAYPLGSGFGPVDHLYLQLGVVKEPG